MSASVSSCLPSSFSTTETFTLKKGSVWMTSSIWMRTTPSTSALAVPSGSFNSCMTVAAEPISYRSPISGSCVSASFCATRATT